jgi:hypothetical protein
LAFDSLSVFKELEVLLLGVTVVFLEARVLWFVFSLPTVDEGEVEGIAAGTSAESIGNHYIISKYGKSRPQ